ncbi:MAG: hypothetical protein PF961_10965, partial [Planctomycetota bacterium]|nr:hypothetical protein [Planctomycetota bacterium]
AGPPAEARKNLRDADYEALAAKLLLHYGVERRVLEGISAGLAEVPQTADKRREMAVTIADRKARIVACCQYIARLNQ